MTADRERAALYGTVLLVGTLLGAGAGIWLVAPALIAEHRLVPTRLAHWTILQSALVLGSAVLGVLLALVVASVLLAFALLRRRPFREPRWALALGIASGLPVAYVASALLVQARYVGPLRVSHPRQLALACGVYCVALLVAVVAYRRIAGRAVRPGMEPLGWVAGTAAVAGIVLLPFRIPSSPALPDDELVLGRAAPGAASRLLLVGIDSGNWETLRPMLARGALPTFDRIVSGGIHGDVEALWPPYWSAPAWAAILTGHPREEAAVYADLTMHAPGLPPFDAPMNAGVLLNPFLLLEWTLMGRDVLRVTHPPRSVLRRRPVWELLEQAGVPSAVIRFDFTYPADGAATVVVSNRVGRDTWTLARVSAGEEEALVAPRDLAAALRAPFAEDGFDRSAAAGVVPAVDAPSAHLSSEIGAVRTALNIDRQTVEAAIRVARLRPDIRFLAVYLGGFDNACHAFWPYRFPAQYADAPPPPADVARFGAVIDRYLAFLDGALGRLLAAYETPPDVILVSDHGHTRNVDMPLGPGWHGPIGIFAAAGPRIPRRVERERVSYYDVVPTIADVMGLGVPRGAHGRSLLRRD